MNDQRDKGQKYILLLFWAITVIKKLHPYIGYLLQKVLKNSFSYFFSTCTFADFKLFKNKSYFDENMAQF